MIVIQCTLQWRYMKGNILGVHCSTETRSASEVQDALPGKCVISGRKWELLVCFEDVLKLFTWLTGPLPIGLQLLGPQGSASAAGRCFGPHLWAEITKWGVCGAPQTVGRQRSSRDAGVSTGLRRTCRTRTVCQHIHGTTVNKARLFATSFSKKPYYPITGNTNQFCHALFEIAIHTFFFKS